MKTIAFIDAAQLRPAIVSSRLNTKKPIDWVKFYNWLADVANIKSGMKTGIHDAHYFDGTSDTNSKDAFHAFLRSQSIQLHFSDTSGKKRECPSCGESYIEIEQKGVDVGIAMHMMHLAFNNAYDQAILVSGDGDFAELVSFIRSVYGKRVIVVGWGNGTAPALASNAYSTLYLEDYKDEFIDGK